MIFVLELKELNCKYISLQILSLNFQKLNIILNTCQHYLFTELKKIMSSDKKDMHSIYTQLDRLCVAPRTILPMEFSRPEHWSG